VPVAEIANTRTSQQPVRISGALIEPLLAGADEDERLLSGDVHPSVQGPAIPLPDDGKLRSPVQNKTTVVDSAVRSNHKVQLAAELTGHIPLQDDTGTGAEANVGDDLQVANA
jgi:hypothetical protein